MDFSQGYRDAQERGQRSGAERRPGVRSGSLEVAELSDRQHRAERPGQFRPVQQGKFPKNNSLRRNFSDSSLTFSGKTTARDRQDTAPH